MGKARKFFIHIDQFIFNQLDLLKNDNGFQKLNDVLLNLNDDQQKILIQTIVFSFILIPYIFITIFWWSNHSIKQRLEIKKQIIEQVALISGNKDALTNISLKFLATNAITNREDLENKIVNIAGRYNINTNKVKLIDFTPISSTSNIFKIEAKFKFSDFGSMDFSNFMREIVDIEKFKILKVDLTKNTENNLLQGTIEIRHVGHAGTN